MDRERSPDWLELYRPHRPDPDLPALEQLEAQLSQSPKLRRRLHAIRELDARIGAAIQAVEVPAGLPSRVLDRLNEQEQSDQRRAYRRRLLTTVGCTLAASLVLVIVWWLQPKKRWNREAVVQRAVELYRKTGDLRGQASDWGDGRDFPPGFNPGYCAGCKLVDFFDLQVRVYQFYAPDRWAQLLMVPAGPFLASIELHSDYPVSVEGLQVLLFECGDFVCAAVVEKAEDLDVFRVERSLT